jgi:hypothetical protein
MPLVVFSINTYYTAIADVMAQGMERDGGFTLRHQFDIPPHEDTEYTLKYVYMNITGDSRFSGRGENKQPSFWIDVKFPNLTDETIISKRHYETIDASHIHADSIAAYRGVILNDFGQMRFPITQFPVNGTNADGLDSNDSRRNANKPLAAKLEMRGMHICDIPLGKMKLEDNELLCRLTPRTIDGETFTTVNAVGGRRARIRNMQVVLEYK